MSEDVDVAVEESAQEVGVTPKAKTKATSKAKSAPKAKPVVNDDEPPFNGATKNQLLDAASYLHLAGDVTRMKILALANGEKSVGDITNEVKITQPALSHHITLLKGARLLSRERDGKVNRYEITKTGKAVLKAINVVVSACDKNRDDED